MKKRYARNLEALSAEENMILREKKVCVAGCGGLGGGGIEGLTRMGVGIIIAVDGDVFDETNLNRQVLSHEKNIGMAKAEEAASQMRIINSDVDVIPVKAFIDSDNAGEIIEGAHVVVDALDNIEARKILEAACKERNIPMVHGAVAGWNGQVAVVMPGDGIISDIYTDDYKGDEVDMGNPYFIPAAISSIQVAETVKLLIGREPSLKSKVLTVDLLNCQYEVIDFGEER